MKKLLCSSLLMIFSLVLAGCSNTAEESHRFILKETVIITCDFNIAQPDIYEDTAVWAGLSLRDPQKQHNYLDQIKTYNINSQEIEVVGETKIDGQTDEAQINQDWICWIDWGSHNNNSMHWDIYAYSRDNQEAIKIDSSFDNQGIMKTELPRLSLANNNYLAWIQAAGPGEDTREIKLHNLSSGKTQSISSINYIKAIPHLSNKYLVWADERKIYVHSLENNEILDIIETTITVNYPKANDEYLVWKESRKESDAILKLKNLTEESGEGSIFEGDIFFFDIGKDYIVWQSKDVIYIYYLPEQETFTLGKGLLPYIRDNNVIFEIQNDEDYKVLKVVNLK